MTVNPDPAAVLDTAFFRRWLDRTTQRISEEAGYLTELDSAIGDADHGINLRRGFTSASAVVAADPPTTPGALLKMFGTHLTNTVGGASGPLYGTVLRRAARALGDEETVSPEALGEALAAAVAGVRRLGDSGPGDKTMVDALAPAAERYGEALRGGASAVEALAAAVRAAREGAEATIPMLARRGRASYLGERSIGHKDPGAASSALLITALYEATDPELGRPAAAAREAAVQELVAEEAAEEAVEQEAAEAEAEREQQAAQVRAEEQVPSPAGADTRVGVVLVAHSREVATATADLAKALVGSGTPVPVGAAGGTDGGGFGTSASLIREAVRSVEAGRGVAVLCDMGSAVLTVKALLTETGAQALPENVRIADAPFLEGAVGAVVTASTGADLDMVISAAEEARDYHKV